MSENKGTLDRELGLTQATALNMIDMVGIGPFLVMPMALGLMGGTAALAAWVLGALVAIVDAFTWAELGARYPMAGGSYNFLRETYSGTKAGRLMSFLFIWQTMIQAPLVVASGSIGFSQYLTYLIPLSIWQQKAVSGTLVIILTALLYRKIGAIGKISVVLWIGVLGTIAWIIFGGVTNFDAEVFSSGFPKDFNLTLVFNAGLGMATVQTIYCYLGYYNVCHLGGEIKQPEKIIPKSMFISIAGITVLYLAMNIGIAGVLPVSVAKDSKFIVSTFIEYLYGPAAAKAATALILWIAFSSLFAVLLGYSRIPYAAALDGNFFSVFAKLHPVKHFPHVSLLALGATAFVFSLLFKLKDVILAIVAMRILVQFIGQAAGLIMLHRKGSGKDFPYRMPYYPLPVMVSIALWLFVFVSTGVNFMLSGLIAISCGVIVYAVREKWLAAKR